MATSRYEKGGAVKVRIDTKTPKSATPPNAYIDPSAVSLIIRKPDKTIETRVYGVDAITRVDVGIFTSIIALSQEGTYHWRWVASNGPSQAGVKTGSFDSYLEPTF